VQTDFTTSVIWGRALSRTIDARVSASTPHYLSASLILIMNLTTSYAFVLLASMKTGCGSHSLIAPYTVIPVPLNLFSITLTSFSGVVNVLFVFSHI
jgi:hypothetical protein